jgi:uncharacterized protein YkwD
MSNAKPLDSAPNMPSRHTSRSNRRTTGLAGLVVAVALFAPSASFGQAPPACANQNDLPSDVGPQVAAAATVCLLNQIRVGQGLTPLHPNNQLAIAAQGHASDMVTNRYFEHDSRDGAHYDDRIKATGYVGRADVWWLGENLAWATQQLATPQAIVEAWMNSPGHRANILEKDFLDIGIAIVTGPPTDDPGPGATYVTDFGQIQAPRRTIRTSHKVHRGRPKRCQGAPQALAPQALVAVSEARARTLNGCGLLWRHAQQYATFEH